MAKMTGRDYGDVVKFVVSPYRICPLGAHIDHQVRRHHKFLLLNSFVFFFFFGEERGSKSHPDLLDRYNTMEYLQIQ